MTRRSRGVEELRRWYLANPSGTTYRDLLLACCDFANIASYVTECDSPLSRTVEHIVGALKPFLMRQPYPTRSWPGMPRGPEVLRYEYRLDKASAMVIGKVANSWFDWCSPERPDDLNLASGAQEFLVGVTHEEMLTLVATKEQFAALLLRVPALPVLSGPGYRGKS